MGKAIYILLAGSCQARSSTVSILVGEAYRVGIYTDTLGASLEGHSLTVCQIGRDGTRHARSFIGDSQRSDVFYGPAEIEVHRPDMTGEGCGVYAKEIDADEWMMSARPCHSISDL